MERCLWAISVLFVRPDAVAGCYSHYAFAEMACSKEEAIGIGIEDLKKMIPGAHHVSVAVSPVSDKVLLNATVKKA